MSTNEDDMARRRQPGEQKPAGGKQVVDSKHKVLPVVPAPGVLEDMVAGSNPDAATRAFSPRDMRRLREHASTSAAQSGAAEESLRNELDAAAWSSVSGAAEPASAEPAAPTRVPRSGRLNPRAAERARREAEGQPGIPVFSDGALDAARSAAENPDAVAEARMRAVGVGAPIEEIVGRRAADEPTEHDHPFGGEFASSTATTGGESDLPEIVWEDLDAVEDEKTGHDGLAVRERAPVHSYVDTRPVSDLDVVAWDAGDDDFNHLTRPRGAAAPEALPLTDENTEDIEPTLSGRPLPERATPVAMPATESMSDDMRAAYGGPAAVADLHARRAAAEPAPRMPAPEPATTPVFDDPDSEAMQAAMRTGAPVAYPQRENPAITVVRPDSEAPTVLDERSALPVSPDADTVRTPQRAAGSVPPRVVAREPITAIRNFFGAKAAAELAGEASGVAEGGPAGALDTMRAHTDERERALVAQSPWKRRLLYGLIGAAGIAFAAIGYDAWSGRGNHPEPDAAADVAAAHEKAAAQPSVPENLPIVPEAVKPVEHTRVIGNGEGVSQAMLGAGVQFEQMMQGLKLPVTIGDKTAQLKDTFVIARGNELGMKIKQDAAGTVTGVDFYKVGSEGTTLSAQELAKYLAIADWRQIQAERSTSVGDSSIDRGNSFDPSVIPEGLETTYSPQEVDLGDLRRILAEDAASGYDDGRFHYSMPVDAVSGGLSNITGNVDGAEIHHADPYADEPTELAPFDPAARIPERFRPTQPRYNDPQPPFVNMGDSGMRSSQVGHDAPTVLMARAIGSEAGGGVDTADRLESLKAPWMPQDYTRHMESLEDNLDATPGRTTYVGNLEFRRVGLRTPEYQVRFDGEKQWSVLDAEMMKELYVRYGLDFRTPEKMRKISKIEFASVLPDGDPTKTAVVRSLETMITQAPLIGFNADYFKKEYKQVTGQDFDAARLVAEEAPTETR